jgi:hypothetical protein
MARYLKSTVNPGDGEQINKYLASFEVEGAE